MNFENYKGKTATIKSTQVIGVIVNVRYKRGADNSLGARFEIKDEDGKIHELMPHELKIENV